ncbi:hypothetical protein CLU99_4013 [Flavobacterium sp. 2]|nr:hypothetical protein CLU99_4013 [Flavobacterium sp. 2]
MYYKLFSLIKSIIFLIHKINKQIIFLTKNNQKATQINTIAHFYDFIKK